MDAAELIRAWTQVWHEGRYDLIPECLGETYIRHDRGGNRVVTRDEYAEFIKNMRERIPDIQFVNEDQVITNDRVWVRYRMTGNNVETGEKLNVGGLQVYRVEDGKLAETWAALAPDGSDWTLPEE